MKLIRYVDSRDYFVMACEFIYMIFVAYYIVEEVELFVIVMILTKTRMRSMLMYIIFVAYYIVEEVDYRNDDDDDEHMTSLPIILSRRYR